MKDTNHISETDIKDTNISNPLEKTGREAMQGGNWTAGDGTTMHGGYEQDVFDEIDDPENDVSVYSEDSVTVSDEENNLKEGRIDSRIDHDGNTTLIDYKTNDMSGWTISDAEKFGNAHGKQMSEYIASPDTPDASKGYIIACGRQSENLEVTSKYVETANSFGVDVLFPSGGTPQDVTDSVQEAMKKTQQINKKGI